jgi:SAM-dependent methyltransferase
MAHEEIKDFYNCEYYGASTGDSKLPWHMRVVAHRLGDLQGRHVLDVACGTGVWLAELASRGAHVAGLDISDRAVEVCTRRIPQAEVATGVAEDLPFGNARFDLVTCLGALEHFIDQPEALSEMRRVAKPSAQLLILVPNAGFLTRRFGLYQGTQQAAVQETVRSIEEWRALFASAGLVVTALWRDLHPLSSGWIARGPLWQWPIRIAQAAVLPVWPLSWQYQIYFLCRLGRG